MKHLVPKYFLKSAETDRPTRPFLDQFTFGHDMQRVNFDHTEIELYSARMKILIAVHDSLILIRTNVFGFVTKSVSGKRGQFNNNLELVES